MIAQCILSRVKLQLHQAVHPPLAHQLEQALDKQQEQVLELEPAQLVGWEELNQEWELNQILSLEWVEWEEWVECHLAWEAWEECQCSLVWQLVVVHLEWEEWVEQTWTHRW